ncbi:MAG TPA: hypothetical protein VGF50_14170 [Caulobacteraceae bacterium]|jgi:hypothetical protein
MTAAAARLMTEARRALQPALDAAVIAAAEIVAGHDGAAELLVRLTHSNGATSAVTLDASTGFALLRAGGAASLADLVGKPWLPLIKDL